MIESIGWESEKCGDALAEKLNLEEPFIPDDRAHITRFEEMTVDELRETLAIVAKTEISPLKEAALYVNLADPYRHSIYDPARVTMFFRFDPEGNFVTELGILRPWMNNGSDAGKVIGPFLTSCSIALLSAKYVEYQSDGRYMELRVQFGSAWTIARILRTVELVRLIVGPDQADPGTPIGAYALLAAGSPEGLLGQVESSFLEVKDRGYGFQNDNQKHEFAMDLAALANTGNGALLVIGLRTIRNVAGQDVISGIPGCPIGSLSVETYNKLARQRIVPPLEGLEVHLREHEDRHLMAIFIPPQPMYLKPFLVKGGITLEGRTSGASFTIPTRIGDARWNMSAEAVHSLLVAARVALAISDSPPPPNTLKDDAKTI